MLSVADHIQCTAGLTMSFVLLRLNVERWTKLGSRLPGMGQQGDSGRTFKSGSISESALNTAYFVGKNFEFG